MKFNFIKQSYIEDTGAKYNFLTLCSTDKWHLMATKLDYIKGVTTLKKLYGKIIYIQFYKFENTANAVQVNPFGLLTKTRATNLLLI